MFRLKVLSAAVAAVFCFAPITLSAQSKVLRLGELAKGEHGGTPKPMGLEVSANQNKDVLGYSQAFPVTLKAGQDISITASVTGKDRLVGILFLDPTMKIVKLKGSTIPALAFAGRKSVSVLAEEISASGKYTILVVSDAIGPFTVRATGDSEEDDEKALEEKAKQLKKELNEIEAKIKAIRDKRQP